MHLVTEGFGSPLLLTGGLSGGTPSMLTSSPIIRGFGGPFLVTGGFGASASPTTTTNAPNPAETVFTLGFGGAVWDGSVASGFALSLAAGLLNAGLAVAYDPGDTLDASVWPGGSEGVTFAPAVAWDTSNGGAPAGRFTLGIAANSTVTLDAGDYRVQVGVTTGGVRSLVFDGLLVVRDIPGSVTIRGVYCSGADLEREYDQLPVLADRLSDTTGFQDVRAEVADLIDHWLVFDRYEGMLLGGRVYTRNAALHPVTHDFDWPTPGTAPPSPIVFSGYLKAGGLIKDRTLRIMAARWTISIILERQETSGRNSYRDEADKFRMMVRREMACFIAQIDSTNPLDGVADFLLKADRLVILPPGTAP